jgi:hypothetical protein
VDEEPDKVEGAVQGRACLSGDEAEVWIRESAAPRAEEKRASFVCHVCSSQFISKSKETARGGVTTPLLGMEKVLRRAIETKFQSSTLAREINFPEFWGYSLLEACLFRVSLARAPLIAFLR